MSEIEEQTLAPTSDEMEASGGKRKMEFTVYDGMLLASVIMIALAILLMFLELRTFGNFPFAFPWRVE